MSRTEYGHFKGIEGRGAPPVVLNTTPSMIGRQVTSREYFAASASIFSLPM